MKKTQWKDLDFNPARDGYWPTPEQIQQRIRDKGKQTKKVAVVIWMTTILAIAFLLFIVWLMIG